MDPTDLANLEYTPDEMAAMGRATLDRVVAHVASLPEQPICGDVDVDDLCRAMREPAPETGADLRTLLDHLYEEWIPRSFTASGPGYMAYIAGGFFASQRGDPAYYGSAGGGGAAGGGAPPVDRTVYADATAGMARVLARASVALDDASLLDCAVRAVERVVAGTYERGGGVAHEARDPSPVRGLLADQVRASAALLDLHALTDREAYLDVAQELMHFAIRRLWDTDGGGGFLDRVHGPDDVGLLRERVRPFGANCEAASVLLRLARLTGSAPFRERAETTLAAQAPAARAHGVDAAPYALALGELNEAGAGGGESAPLNAPT